MASAMDSAKRRTLQALLSLPPGVVRALAGRPVEVDGTTLDAEIQLILKLQKLEGRAIEDRPIPEGRHELVRRSEAVGGNLPIGAVTDLDIEGPSGPLRLRCYTPRGLSTTSPALFFAHGGGFVYGDLDSHDAVCRFLAERAEIRVIAVDYRLAPEFPFPAAVEDIEAAFSFVSTNATGLGITANRIAVGGDSAGANLAAGLAQHAAREDIAAPPAFQLLIYPNTDFAVERPSRTTYENGFVLSKQFVEVTDTSYIPSGTNRTDPRLSPIYGDLTGLPPAYVVTAGFDPLRDEGDEYAEKLRQAGVAVEHVVERRLIHSFANIVGVGRSGPEAMGRAASALRRALFNPAVSSPASLRPGPNS